MPQTFGKVPEPGLIVKRTADGRYEVWQVLVLKLGELERVRIPGRNVWQTPKGTVRPNATEAAESLQRELERGA